MTRRKLVALAGGVSAWGQSRVRMPVLGRAFDVSSGALVSIYGQPGSLVMAPVADVAARGGRAVAGANGEFLLTVDDAGVATRWNADATRRPLLEVPASPTSFLVSERGGAAGFGYSQEVLAVTMGKEYRTTLRVPLANARVLAVRDDGRQAVVATGAELWLISGSHQPVSLGEAQPRAVAGFAGESIISADASVRRWSAAAGWAELAPCREAVAVAAAEGDKILVADADGVLALTPSGATRYGSYLPPTQLLRLGGGCYLVTGFDSELVLVFAPDRGVVTVIRREVTV